MNTKRCNKCKKMKSVLDFKNDRMKRCLACNQTQHAINNKGNMERQLEYKGLRQLRDLMRTECMIHPTEMLKARITLYSTIIRMVEFDPERGDMKENMTEEELELWKSFSKDIREAGEIILQHFNSTDENDRFALNHYLTYIPTSLRRDVELKWNGLKFKDGVEWLY